MDHTKEFAEIVSDIVSAVPFLHGEFSRKICDLDITKTYFGLLDRSLFHYICEFLRDPKLSLHGLRRLNVPKLTYINLIPVSPAGPLVEFVSVANTAQSYCIDQRGKFYTLKNNSRTEDPEFEKLCDKFYELYVPDIRGPLSRVMSDAKNEKFLRIISDKLSCNMNMLDVSGDDFTIFAYGLTVDAYLATNTAINAVQYRIDCVDLYRVGLIQNIVQFSTVPCPKKPEHSAFHNAVIYPTYTLTDKFGVAVELERKNLREYLETPYFDVYKKMEATYTMRDSRKLRFDLLQTFSNCCIGINKTAKNTANVFYCIDGQEIVRLGKLPKMPTKIFIVNFDCFICDYESYVELYTIVHG